MTEKKKNEIAASLIELSFAIKEREYIATNDRDFDTLKEIVNQQGAIDILLNAIAKL